MRKILTLVLGIFGIGSSDSHCRVQAPPVREPDLVRVHLFAQQVSEIEFRYRRCRNHHEMRQRLASQWGEMRDHLRAAQEGSVLASCASYDPPRNERQAYDRRKFDELVSQWLAEELDAKLGLESIPSPPREQTPEWYLDALQAEADREDRLAERQALARARA